MPYLPHHLNIWNIGITLNSGEKNLKTLGKTDGTRQQKRLDLLMIRSFIYLPSFLPAGCPVTQVPEK